ncbi:peptidylprolyl isomerase [Paenibacillus tarimensis]
MLHNKRVSSWRRSLLLIVAAILVVTIAAGCGKKNEQENGTGGAAQDEASGAVVATYKDGEVKEEEFNKYSTFFAVMNPQYEMVLSIPQYKEQFLKEYIGYKIMFDRVSDDVKKETQADADTFEQQLQTAVDSDEATKAKMEEAGLTVADAKAFYHLVITVMKDAESKVTDEAAQAEYDKDPASHTIVSVRHILIATTDSSTGEEKRSKEDALARAKEVKDKLDAGGDWTELAKEYSEDPGSKDNGGLYENQAASGWVEAFKEASLNQPIGEVGEPVETEYGYHVMKVEKREKSDVTPRQAAAGAVLNEFMEKELPGLIEKINLPQEETEEAPPAGEGQDDAATNDQTSGNGENATNSDTAQDSDKK